MMHVPDVNEHEADKAPATPPAKPAAEVDRPSADAAALPLHLSFTPDRADFEALYATARTPVWQPAASFVGFFAIGVLVGWAGDNIPLIRTILTWSKYSLIALLLVFIVAGHAAVLALRRLFRRLRAARAAAAAGPVEFAAYDDFVSIADGGRTDIHPWREVLSATLGRGHVFLVVTGRRRLVLPRRAFADGAAMNAFAFAAEEHVRLERAHEEAAPAATPEGVR